MEEISAFVLTATIAVVSICFLLNNLAGSPSALPAAAGKVFEKAQLGVHSQHVVSA